MKHEHRDVVTAELATVLTTARIELTRLSAECVRRAETELRLMRERDRHESEVVELTRVAAAAEDAEEAIFDLLNTAQSYLDCDLDHVIAAARRD